MATQPPVYSAQGVPDDSGPWSGVAIDLSSTDFTPTTYIRGIYVGVTGDITVDFASSGTNILLKAVPVGYLAGHFTKVYKTGTAATNLVAVW